MKQSRATVLTLLLAALAAAPAAAGERPFPDVPREHWAYDAVEELRRRGILRGYPPAPPRAAPERKAPPAAPERRQKRAARR